MRVGLVVPGFSADAADWCIPALRHLARELSRIDEVLVIAVRYPYQSARYAIDGLEVVALGGGSRRGAATSAVWTTVLKTLAIEHQRRPFDVLHAFWATESGFLTAIAGRWLPIPTVVSLAGGELVGLRDIGYGDQRRPWERLKIAASLRLAGRVTAGSHHLLALARRHVPGARLHRAPLGVPLDMFSPARQPPSKQRILHVGTLTPVKDQATLLRAFAAARARRPELTLTIVGQGPLRGSLESLACSLGISGAVCFRGDMAHDALPDVYRASSAFVLSSRHEAQGMVALEAAACGLPVVGTDVGIIPELTSCAAAVQDHTALAGLLLAVTADPQSATDLAQQRVRQDFALDVCTSRFRSLYAALQSQVSRR